MIVVRALKSVMRRRPPALASQTAQRLWKTEMVAQRRAAIFLAEQAAALQDRHHRVDENLEPGRQHIRHQVEAVGGASSKPRLDVVGDGLGRTVASPGKITMASADRP
jgi:hypothetical protein